MARGIPEVMEHPSAGLDKLSERVPVRRVPEHRECSTSTRPARTRPGGREEGKKKEGREGVLSPQLRVISYAFALLTWKKD